ncbi:MAG: hypothetical protein GXP25_07730 [Planctomycetes bacterium]|nr:hypothetical protein [Planctomycetota bacterium]
MLGSLSEGPGRGGCRKKVGIGCLVLTVLAVIGIVWFLRFLVAPGKVPPAEAFITPACRGFLILRIRPDDKGVQTFLIDREKKFQKKLETGKAKRPPWIFRQMFGETPAQHWKKLMPVQMVWTVGRKPGLKELEGMSIFSMSRGKGIFWGLRSQLVKSAKGAELAGEYKDKQIILLKDISAKKGNAKGSGKDEKEKTESPDALDQPPGAPLFGMSKPTTYPWITIFETSLLEASTFEGIKEAIDIATDPKAAFAGKGFIKSAYESFDKNMEVIGALAGEEKTAASVITYLLSMLTTEEEKEIQERVKLAGIRELSGCADLVGADRAHVRIEAVCADEKAAQAVHSVFSVELGALQEKKSIGALTHAVEGSKVSIEFDVSDLDDFPRGERERREKAKKEMEEAKKKKVEDGDADSNH